MKSKILALSKNEDFKNLLQKKKTSNKNMTIKYNYSYLVIAKPTMLNNEYKNIKETLFQSLKEIR